MILLIIIALLILTALGIVGNFIKLIWQLGKLSWLVLNALFLGINLGMERRH